MTGGRERRWRFYKVLFLLELSRSGKRKDRGRREVFILFSLITAKLGRPRLLQGSPCEKGLCRDHLSRLTPTIPDHYHYSRQ